MRCSWIGRPPLAELYDADMVPRSHWKCQACGRVVRLGHGQAVPAHRTEKSLNYVNTMAEARSELKKLGETVQLIGNLTPLRQMISSIRQLRMELRSKG